MDVLRVTSNVYFISIAEWLGFYPESYTFRPALGFL